MSVLTVFDVRGIQEFIFRTNKIKEIIGASEIIKNILRKCFEEACEYVFGKNNSEKMDFDWENKSEEFDFEGKKYLQVEIIYEGGGNLYAAFKSEDEYKRVYRRMNEIILEKTYSLSVSSAFIKCKEDYKEDIDKLMNNLNVAKQKNPPLTLPRGIAVTKRDSISGLPIVSRNIYKSDINDNDFNSTEANLKLKTYIKYKEDSNKYDDFNYMLNLDEMVTDKGTESLLAIVHIDGNNMAHAIKERMAKETKYKYAVPKIRKLSQIITNSFTIEAYNVMPEALEKAICTNNDWKKLDINKNCDRPKLPMRPIICAGDDITFICNARIAIPLTKLYLEKIVQCGKNQKNNSESGKLDNNAKSSENDMQFSACAGIAFIHSHFPFNLAYKIAEECCSNAKAEAKSKASDITRGFIDYHFCFSGVTEDLESMRKNQYVNDDGYSLLRRPWQVTGKEIDPLKGIRMLEEFAEYFSTGKTPKEESNNSESKVSNKNCETSKETDINDSAEKSDDSSKKKQLKAWPSTRVAEFRNQYFSSYDDLQDTIKQFKSRGYYLPEYQKYLNRDIFEESDEKEKNKAFYNDGNSFKAIYYDSLEISDIYCNLDDFALEFINNKLNAQLDEQKKKEMKN
jgi:hypothetical protein